MKKNSYIWWKYTPLLLLFVVSQIIGCGREEGDDSPSSIHRGIALMDTAPDFVLEDLSGNQKSSKEYKGQIIVLNFWATWCTYCRIEIPDLNHLNEKYGDQGVRFVGISMDASSRAVRRFLDDVPIEYDVLMGNSKISRDFGGITGLPTTFIIDRQWRIRQIIPGYVGRQTIEKGIKTLLLTKS